MMRAWILPTLFVLSGSVVATGLVLEGSPVEAGVLLVVFLLLAGVNSPLMFPRSIGALEAQRRSAVDGRPVVFWRAGCRYCLRLRIRLGRGARRAYWVDIWRDPAGAAAVRADRLRGGAAARQSRSRVGARTALSFRVIRNSAFPGIRYRITVSCGILEKIGRISWHAT